MTSYADRYGPWALVAGASEGAGAHYAEELATRGLNVVLLARRQDALDAVAAGITERTGVRTRTLALDLSLPDAAERVVAGVADLEIGTLVYCAGADADYRHFLDGPVGIAEALIHRNCTVLAQLCHACAGPMAERGRGAVVIFGSGAGFAGAPNMVAYAATKAFDMVFAEALWSELKPRGVDVLGLVLGETDTPALRRLKHSRGLLRSLEERPRGAASVESVVADAFRHLEDGPIRMAHPQMRIASRIFFPLGRNGMTRLIGKASARTMGA